MKLNDDVITILNTFKAHGEKCYLVGGCVRDYLRNQEPHDWDFCTNLTPDKVEELFKNKRVIETGIKHGTVTVLINDTPYEITTFRIDGEYSDNRHPDEVVFTEDIVKDLSRRDFTMNAIAFDGENFIDPFKGIEDIKNGIIRCVRDPGERFKEDPLRILRAIRFSARMNYDIAPETEKAMYEHKELITLLSKERINSEFLKILESDIIKKILIKYKDILAVFIPEIKPMFSFKVENSEKTLYDYVANIVQYGDNLIVRLAALFQHLALPSYPHPKSFSGIFCNYDSVPLAEYILVRLRMDNHTKEQVIFLIEEHQYASRCHTTNIKWLASQYGNCHTVNIKWLISLYGVEKVQNLLLLRKANIQGQPHSDHKKLQLLSNKRALRQFEEILNRRDCVSISQLDIKGEDLIELGIPQSKTMKIILAELLRRVIWDEGDNKKDDLKIHAKVIYLELKGQEKND